MRTAPLALAYLYDEAGLIKAARTVCDFRHAEPLAGDACVLWCLAIRTAVTIGKLDLQAGLVAIPEERCGEWDARIGEAEQK